MTRKRTGSARKSSDHATRNRPPEGESWIWITEQMWNSPAWNVMGANAKKVVERTVIEHLARNGTENGNLIVTYSDFQRYGIRRKSIRPAIVEADVLGFIDVIKRGGRAYADLRIPSIYSLTWLPRKDDTPSTSRWKVFKTVADAHKAVRAALTTEARTCRQKQKARGENAPGARGASAPKLPLSQGRKRHQSTPKARGENATALFSIHTRSRCRDESESAASPRQGLGPATISQTDDNADPQQPSCRAAPSGARQGAVAAPSSGGVRPAVAEAGRPPLTFRGNGVSSEGQVYVERWLTDCCVEDKTAQTRSSELLTSSRAWAKCNGRMNGAPILEQDLINVLAGKGYGHFRSRLGVVFSGIRLSS